MASEIELRGDEGNWQRFFFIYMVLSIALLLAIVHLMPPWTRRIDWMLGGTAVVVLGGVWALGLLVHFVPGVRCLLSDWVGWLRMHTFLCWLLLLVWLALAFIGWSCLDVAAMRHSGYRVSGAENAQRLLEYFGVFYLLSVVFPGFVLLYLPWRQRERKHCLDFVKRARAVNYLLLLTSAMAAAGAAELGTHLFYVASHGNVNVLIHQNWMRRYWKPLNTLGYRDYPPRALPEGVQRVLVLGDSVASGWGVKEIDETFPHVLERRLGEGFHCNLAAEPGWDTNRQTEALKSFPFAPDIVILSYVLNDIDVAASHASSPTVRKLLAEGHHSEGYPSNIVASFFLRNFFLPNLTYWTLIGRTKGAGPYLDYLRVAYSDPETWEAHAEALNALIDAAESLEARLILLIWPSEVDYSISDPITNRVGAVFEKRGCVVANMKTVMNGLDASQLYASPFDRHPSAYRHRLAAELLEPLVRGGRR